MTLARTEQVARITITEALNLVHPVAENFSGSMSLLIEGALLAVWIVGLFLRNLRATLISTATLPLSIVPTFLVMHLLDYSLNFIALLRW